MFGLYFWILTLFLWVFSITNWNCFTDWLVASLVCKGAGGGRTGPSHPSYKLESPPCTPPLPPYLPSSPIFKSLQHFRMAYLCEKTKTETYVREIETGTGIKPVLKKELLITDHANYYVRKSSILQYISISIKATSWFSWLTVVESQWGIISFFKSLQEHVFKPSFHCSWD